VCLSSGVRILFSCRPAHGHLNPLLPLATACRAAGHEVVFGTGEQALPRLRELGFRADRVGIAIDAADQLALGEDPGLADLPREERWRIGVAVFGNVLARRTLEDLRPLLDDVSPDLVVYDETDVGAGAAAQAAGVPAVAHSLGRRLPDPIRRAVLDRLQGVVRESHRDAAPGDLLAGNAYLDICPPTLQDPAVSEPGERIPLRPVAPIGPEDAVPDWILTTRSRPLAYLTLGTYVSGHVDSLRAAATGLGTLAIDTLVTVGPDGDRAALGPLPAAVRVERYVPQGVLLPHVDVVAHHGGSGTMLAALSHGLPQLLLPHGADQFMHANALVGCGAGVRLLPEEITPEAVATAVQLLLDEPGYRQAAGRLADEIAAMPAPAETVPVLERLAQR
jgi:UDP:flavonoid glycosyltransferase YjiC (YdhE family)